jgi:hypothetical protein
LTVFDENLMFVVQSTRDPSHYAVVIRGTNPVSIANWLLQDFAIIVQTPWPYDSPPALAPKLSKGTARGLQALQRMTPAQGLPGAGVNLYQFLANRVYESAGRELRLSITGHSLGGALAPALALWLLDTRERSDDPESPPWDRRLSSQIEVFPFAGPSPGNKDFAAYYDSRLGDHTRRLYNAFDVVPHVWACAALQKLPALYHPEITPNWLVKLLLRAALYLAEGRDYVQIMSQSLPLEGGRLSGVLHEYVPEMIYQHTAAYCELLKLEGVLDAFVHFDLDESLRAVIARRRNVEGGGPAARTASNTAAPNMTKPPWLASIHRAYRLPASVFLPFVPKQVALAHLRRRKSRYDQPGASELGGAHERSMTQERNQTREQNAGRPRWGATNGAWREPNGSNQA